MGIQLYHEDIENGNTELYRTRIENMGIQIYDEDIEYGNTELYKTRMMMIKYHVQVASHHLHVSSSRIHSLVRVVFCHTAKNIVVKIIIVRS